MHTQPTHSTLARLRALTPRRGLDAATALSIAERQATMLLRVSGQTSAPISLRAIETLPCVELAIVNGLPASGTSFWTGQTWRLEANSGEHVHRQRFTFAHEFKHVIDHPSRDLLYGDHATRERVADQFAACLLMPKLLVTRAWCSGEQDIDQLADHFAVSAEAMTRRLLNLGLITRRRPQPIFCTRGSRNPLRTRQSFAIAGDIPIGDTP